MRVDETAACMAGRLDMTDAIDDGRRALAAGLMAEATARLEHLIELSFDRHDGSLPADELLSGANDLMALLRAYQVLRTP